MMNKKNLPHIITVVTLVVFIVLGLSSTATIPDATLSSSYGITATSSQQYNAENDFSFSGTNFGVMEEVGNRFISRGIITDYNGRTSDVLIPPIIQRTVVVSIGRGAFYNKNITSITIPDMVNAGRINTIDYRVVATLSGTHQDVDGYAGISRIEEQAFANNPLTSLTLGNGVSYIGRRAFYNTKLTNVTFPDSVISIDDYAFFGNWDKTNDKPIGTITSITLGNHVSTIGAHAFENNPLTSVIIPNSVTTIGDMAFADNKLIDVTIPGSVKELGKKIFTNNPINSITIQNGVTSIGEETFADTPITSINIPSSIRTIGKNAFAGSKLTTITIENGITNIGDLAFANLSLTSITIPNSVTHITGNAFTGTNNLTQITIGPNVTITGNELMPFNFRGAYLENSLRAGTYTFTNGRWTGQFR